MLTASFNFLVVFQQRRTAVGFWSRSEVQCWWSCSC